MNINFTPSGYKLSYKNQEEQKKSPAQKEEKAAITKQDTPAITTKEFELADALLRQALENFQKGSFETAKDLLMNAIRIKPNDATILHNLGTVLNKLGLFQEAVKFLSQALEQNPNNIITINNLGFAYYHLKIYNKAILYFKQACHIDPANFTFARHLGLSYFHQGLYEEALLYLKKALKLKPEDEIAQKFYKKAAGLVKEEAIKKLEEDLKQKTDETSKTIFKYLTCPLTKHIFRNPVMLPTGETVDLTKEIKDLITEQNKNPLHQENTLALDDVIPNKHILQLIKSLSTNVKKNLGGEENE